MGVWTALLVALQLLLKMCLDAEAQVLGECRTYEVSKDDSSLLQEVMKEKLSSYELPHYRKGLFVSSDWQ